MIGDRHGRALGMAKRDTLSTIKLYRADIKEYLRAYKRASVSFKRAVVKYKLADDAYMKRSSGRNENRLGRASERLRDAHIKYYGLSSRIDGALATIEREYESLFEIYEAAGNERELERAKLSLEEYKAEIKSKMERADRTEGVVSPIEFDTPEYIDEAERAAEINREERGRVDFIPDNPASSVTSVNIAPVTIDVTPIIESAINAALEKLKVGLDEKISDYINNLESYSDVAKKEQELLEQQKNVLDMQRRMLRDQQGVLVNQKLLVTEQNELSLSQALTLEKQSSTVEVQRSVLSAQDDLINIMNAVVEAEGALEAAMKTVATAQKELVQSAESIIAANEKNQAASEALIEKQSLINAAQKQTLASNKKLFKDQNNINVKK